MSYGFDYVTADGKTGSNIHCFKTRREANAYAKFMREAGFTTVYETTVVVRKEPAGAGWLHGRLVHLYPMNF